MLVLRIAVLALAAAVLAPAQDVFRAAGGVYSVPIPQGWKVTDRNDRGDVHLLSADKHAFFGVSYYGALDTAPGAMEAYKRRLVAAVMGASTKLVKTVNVQVDGDPATAEIYSGIESHTKLEIVIRFVTVRTGKAGFVMMMEAGTDEWNRWKADLGAMEHGLRFARMAPGGNFTPVGE